MAGTLYPPTTQKKNAHTQRQANLHAQEPAYFETTQPTRVLGLQTRTHVHAHRPAYQTRVQEAQNTSHKPQASHHHHQRFSVVLPALNRMRMLARLSSKPAHRALSRAASNTPLAIQNTAVIDVGTETTLYLLLPLFYPTRGREHDMAIDTEAAWTAKQNARGGSNVRMADNSLHPAPILPPPPPHYRWILLHFPPPFCAASAFAALPPESTHSGSPVVSSLPM